MNDYSVKVGADVSNYNKNIDSARDSTEKFQKSADDASKSLDDISKKGGKSAKELLDQMRSMEKGARSVSNYRRQLSQMTRDIQDLTINYATMSKEMQDSDIGRESILKIQELTREAGKYKDAILDAQSAINAIASDTQTWDAVKQGISTASSALQGFVSLGIVNEKSTEKLVSILTKLKGIEAATNSVIQVGNALQKQSALMMGISRVQAAALAKATTLQAAATGKATLAQKAFNLVAKSNPYVLLASAILAVVAAIGTYAAITKKWRSTTDDVLTIQTKLNKKMKEVSGSSVENVAKFKMLENSYRQMRTETEKLEWIKNNKTEMDKLGLSVKNVNEADETFIKHSSDIIRALQLRAEAEGLMALYQEQYIEAYQKAREIGEGKESSFKSASYIRKEWKDAGLKAGEDFKQSFMMGSSTIGQGNVSNFYLTEAGSEKLKKYWQNRGEDSMKNFEKGAEGVVTLINQKLTEAIKLENSLSAFKKDNDNNNNNNKDKNRELVNELDILKQRKSTLEEELRYIEAGSDEWRKQLKDINDIEIKIKALEDNLKAYVNRLNTTKIDIPVMKPKNLEGKAEFTPVLKEDIKLSPDALVKEYQNALELAAKVTDWQRVGAITTQQADNMIKNINEYLKDHGINIPVSLDGSQFEDTLLRWVDAIDTFEYGASGFVSGINSIYESIDNLGSKLDEASNGWESFFATFEAGMTILSSIASIINSITTLTELLNKVKASGIATIFSETAAIKSNTAAKLENAGASAAEAVAGGASSVASIPVVGWIMAGVAAVTLLATLLSSMKSAKKFAGGGIIGGNNHNDGILARVSSGEMILNEKQQANLFKMLNEGNNTTSGESKNQQVELKVRGTDLVAVLNNYTNKRSKV